MTSETRDFDLGVVLTISDGRLLSPDGMQGIYEILSFMTGDSIFTHVIPRAMRTCAPAILAQHPRLADVDRETQIGPDNLRDWLAAQKRIYGERLTIAPLPPQIWIAVDPVLEAQAMFGRDRVIAAALEGSV